VRIFHALTVEGTGEWAVGRAAGWQRGLVHRVQLDGAEISRSAIGRLTRQGWLYPVLPRVYSVGSPTLQPLAAELATLLYLRHDAVISHQSAAMLWGIAPAPRDLVQVTVIGRDVRRREGLEPHRVARLDPRDVRLRSGIPVTAPARALIDLAGQGSYEALAHAHQQACVLGLVTDGELEAALARCPSRTGTANLQAWLESDQGASFTRSDAERRILALIAGAGLPRPQVNARVGGFEVDLLWRRERLVVEIDGHAFHGHRSAFERDRRRDQVLAAAGFRVIRITWLQLEREPLAVIGRIAQALAIAAAV
jgi:very-short-patch-repair endonuclease